MKNSTPKIAIILVAVIVFPTLFFSVYEVNNISKNQQVVDSIYASQLENIVSSLNDFSVNAITNWADKLDKEEILDKNNLESQIGSIIRNYQPIKGVFLSSSSSVFAIYNDTTNVINQLNIDIQHLLVNNDSMTHKLERFISNGWRKMHPVYNNNGVSVFLFALHNTDSTFSLGGFVIDNKDFIAEVLGPKMQSMAQNLFIISISEGNEQLYSSVLNDDDQRVRIEEPMWLFPKFKVGVQLLNDPVEQMVEERTRTNIFLIILMDLVLVIGAWFVFRSIRQQINLAQIKSEFVSNVSHEIKTPLALITMYSETLEMGRIPTEEKKKEYFKVINKEAKRLARMVNKILSFSKIENGKREYSFVETDINEIVSQVVSTYQHHFKNSGFEHEINYAENLPLVKLDEEAIIDAVSNLIDNGMKYSAEIKSIEIKTGVKNSAVFVSVKDSGVGIKDKNQKLIFDKFYRVTDGNLANMAKGSGIGLNIVKNIMEAHSGKITVKSSLGKGSTFTLSFPHI